MTQSIEVSAARMERVALAVYARQHVVVCCVLANETFGNVTGDSLVDEDTTWSEVAVVAASFAKAGRAMLVRHPEKYAGALREIARVMLEGANRLDPEGAPS